MRRLLLRRAGALLAGGALEREAAASLRDVAAAASRCAPAAALRLLATSAGGVEPDELPLPESKLKDDVEDALHGEAEELPVEEDAAAVLAGGGAAQPAAPAGGIAALPLGQGLRQEASFQGRPWTFETGRMARLANGSCMVQAGGTTVLAAATCQPPPWSRRDALSLQFEVDYREKLYAVGRIPSTYNKREGTAKEHELLAGRRIGRALRPLFPRGFAQDCVAFAHVLSADGASDPDTLAVSAASTALLCSDMPWAGPVAAARAALLPGGELVVGPTVEQQEAASLNVVVAVTEAGRVTMMEADGDQVPEAEFLRALRAAAEAAAQLLEPQRQLAAQTGRQTVEAQLAGADPAAVPKVHELLAGPIEAILRDASLGKAARAAALQQAKDAALARLKAVGAFRTEFARLPSSGCVSPADLDHAFGALLSATMRRLAVEEGWRCDGRGPIDLRPVHCEVDSIPIVHGSALFTRGETQSLCTATVGRRGEQQKAESLLGGESSKRLFVNYSFPPFAVDDTQISGLRREMGHSDLAERALLPVIPAIADFPFSLRLNADTLASAGSSSMAAVCGGSMALADAGVPLKALVAGVSVGLLTDSSWGGAARTLPPAPAGQQQEVAPVGRYELLTDLQGIEDQLGDMDLKVAGTRAGITAAQLDVKLPGGVPLDIVEEAVHAAARGRAQLLTIMEQAVPKERPASAPQHGSVRVPEGMLGRVIGSGGATVKEVEEAFDARIDIQDSGLIHIFAPNRAGYQAAEARILGLAGESVKAGQQYRGRVVRLLDFGAMLELEGLGLRALLHISEVAPTRIRAIDDVLQVGQDVDVLCLGKDQKGNVRLSRKALLARQEAQAAAKKAVGQGGGLDAEK